MVAFYCSTGSLQEKKIESCCAEMAPWRLEPMDCNVGKVEIKINERRKLIQGRMSNSCVGGEKYSRRPKLFCCNGRQILRTYLHLACSSCTVMFYLWSSIWVSPPPPALYFSVAPQCYVSSSNKAELPGTVGKKRHEEIGLQHPGQSSGRGQLVPTKLQIRWST